jgi:hypothetical protein
MSYVYVIETIIDGKPSSPCKLGITAKPRRRMQMLQCASPHDLRFRQIWDARLCPVKITASEIESALHRALEDRGLRLRGEWFNISPDDLDWSVNRALAFMLTQSGGMSDEASNLSVRKMQCGGCKFDVAGRPKVKAEAW